MHFSAQNLTGHLPSGSWTALSLTQIASTRRLPVTFAKLTALVDLLEEFINNLKSLREVIGLCGSFLTLREDTVYFVHQFTK
jgi:hypothetical protein